jgi:quercetin dioxygenase-like cupin family protein
MRLQVLYRRKALLVRRMRLEPGEASAWHRDACHRVSVVLSGDRLAIEYKAGGPTHEVRVQVGQVDWDEPGSKLHRAVNAGRQPYKEVVMFLLAHARQNPQPASLSRTRRRTTRS